MFRSGATFGAVFEALGAPRNDQAITDVQLSKAEQ